MNQLTTFTIANLKKVKFIVLIVFMLIFVFRVLDNYNLHSARCIVKTHSSKMIANSYRILKCMWEMGGSI